VCTMLLQLAQQMKLASQGTLLQLRAAPAISAAGTCLTSTQLLHTSTQLVDKAQGRCTNKSR
jgi:hypothetical protein